jgi:hypothetical protein
MEMAWSGQASTHKPQPMQVSQSTIIGIPSKAVVESLYSDSLRTFFLFSSAALTGKIWKLRKEKRKM